MPPIMRILSCFRPLSDWIDIAGSTIATGFFHDESPPPPGRRENRDRPKDG